MSIDNKIKDLINKIKKGMVFITMPFVIYLTPSSTIAQKFINEYNTHYNMPQTIEITKIAGCTTIEEISYLKNFDGRNYKENDREIERGYEVTSFRSPYTSTTPWRKDSEFAPQDNRQPEFMPDVALPYRRKEQFSEEDEESKRRKDPF